MAMVNEVRKQIKLPNLPVPRDELALPIGAVSNMPSLNNSYTSAPAQPSTAPPPLPIAAVLGMSSYPIASIYPPNKSSVLGGGDSDLSRDSNDSVSTHVPFFLPHLVWECAVDSHDPSCLSRIPVSALIDHGSPPVLIDQALVSHLCLPTCPLSHPFPISGAFFNNSSDLSHVSLTHWVKLKLHNHNNLYSACTICAIVAPSLCHSIILGLPFLSHNQIVVNAHDRTAIDTNCLFDLLHPVPPVMLKPKTKLHDTFAKVTANRKLLVKELKEFCVSHRPLIDAKCEHVKDVDIVAAI
jgi:hypothetical protein